MGAIILLIALIAVTFYAIQTGKQKEEEMSLPYTELIKNISDDTVEKIEMKSGSNVVDVKLRDIEEEKQTRVPNLQAFTEYVQRKVEEGSQIEVEQKSEGAMTFIKDNLFQVITIVLMISIFVLIFKMQGLGDKGKVYDSEENETNTKFDDIAGLDEEKKELVEIVDFLKNPDEFYRMGAKVPKGILLCGKPGTGKTLIAKAVAGEAKVPFIQMSGSEFIEMFAGLGASRVRKLFEKARKISPCIVFIDEIDAIGARRTNASGAESENNQTLNQLLVEMDGFDSTETIIVLAATNRPEMLDKALLRPGRFDRQIMIGTPDKKGREEILKIHAKEKQFAEDVSFKDIAEDTAGFTGAELANILNEAAIIATVKKKESIHRDDIEEAIKKVTVGLEKHSRLISEKDKKLTAYHEAGHAVVSRYLETQNDVKEISIVPRGVAGGYTMYRSNEDKYYVAKTELEEKLIALLGGRAAEKIALNDISTGASNDLEVATGIARDMITMYGMSDTIGPISMQSAANPDQIIVYGEKMEDAIGAEIKILIDTAYQRAQRILIEHRDKLDRVAQILLEKEKITEKEFYEIFE
ncbi:MAG TPA: ATP-dependent zinc metalloprotease FtsH [Candidatus Merdicola faecigallinarum]|uniref:ATP-dependent zinc metalloprotease FtsH n=1 Tax=Candidatus Merdicola faecigallinarum TaxID=2840862 RepID=A0A9D1SA50_9FIRM|nr:ATP-dependent zinc metalloprotease FtsH [Candidatus Merdicola faecigallinarum]